MDPGAIKNRLPDFGRVLALSAVLAPLAAVNLVINPMPLSGHAMLFLGSCYALLSAKIGAADAEIRAGYVQSGEGAMGLLSLAVVVSFLSIHRAAAAAVCFAVMMIIEYYMHMVGRPSVRGRVAGGIVINLCAAAAGWYAVTRTGTPFAEVERVLAGYSRAGGGIAWEAFVFLAAFIMLYAFLLKAQTGLRLYSQGKSYFEITGLRYGRVRAGFIAARAVAVSGMVLFAGCLAGVEYLAGMMREKDPVADEIKTLLAVNIFLQAMALLGALAGWTVAAATAVSLSYLLLYLYRRRYPHG